jgi:citronellol/citronellal dehydrogenase
MQQSLKDRVIFITGGSRGIGKEIALRFAADGAKIVIAAKTAEPHPKLAGTIYTAAEEIEKAGGEALPLMVDVREEAQVQAAIDKTIETFGGIDILVNNASAINLSSTLDIPMKRFDLIFSVNVRATFMCSKLCIPHLRKSRNPHILNLSPPLSMNQKWFKKHVAYTMSKYGMSMCTLGMAGEFKSEGIAVNSLWPRTLIATAAIENNFPKIIYHASRKPSIVADAAYAIVTSDSREVTGNFFIDEEILRARGVTNFGEYAMHKWVPLYPDIFVDEK